LIDAACSADLPPEPRAFQVRAVEVEADQDASRHDLRDDVAEARESRVVLVTRLSGVNGISSVPKNASSAVTSAVLWQACPDWVLGVVWCCSERFPSWVGDGWFSPDCE
jgi:hypothetical protein